MTYKIFQFYFKLLLQTVRYTNYILFMRNS